MSSKSKTKAERSQTMSKKEGGKPMTTVSVSYAPYRLDLPMPGGCPVTIYTATGPRHPVMARIKERTITGWVDRGEHLVNNWLVGSAGNPLGESWEFTFECPAPDQYWEIHIESPSWRFPNYLDSMIGSCENRSFSILYPGTIIRDSPRARSEAEVFANYVSKPAKSESDSATA
jgi:hypothetical protein